MDIKVKLIYQNLNTANLRKQTIYLLIPHYFKYRPEMKRERYFK